MVTFAYPVESKGRLAEVIEAIEAKFAVKREPQRVIRKTVLDTFDWRLFGQDANLQAIFDDGQVWLSLETSRQAMRCRVANGKLPAFEWDLPPGRMRQRIGSAIDVRRLLAQLQVELEVQSIRLLNADEKTVARLHVQGGTARRPDDDGARTPLPLSVSLTPVRGYERSQRDAADIIENEVGLKRTEETLLGAAMRAVGVEPGTYVAKRTPALEPDSRADEATVAICKSLLETMRANENGMQRNLDSEFLHDYRVAVRRTRSALRLLKGVLPGDARAHFKKEFKWLGSITGRVRDLDVYLLNMPTYRADLPESMRQDLDPLDEYLHRHHRDERRRLVVRLRSKRYTKMLSEWQTFLDSGPFDEASCPDAARPIADVASQRIWKAYRRVYKHGRNIAPETPPKALHELRIDCKLLRYLLEFFRSLYPPKDIAKLVKALRQLQDNLGDFNDLQVQQESLRRFAQEMSDEGLASVQSLLAMGRLVEHLAQRQNEERASFAHCWSKFVTRTNCERFRHLFNSSATPTR